MKGDLLIAAKIIDNINKNSNFDVDISEKLHEIVNRLCLYNAMLNDEITPDNIIPFKKG
jgi:muconolactone delta-isomerase